MTLYLFRDEAGQVARWTIPEGAPPPFHADFGGGWVPLELEPGERTVAAVVCGPDVPAGVPPNQTEIAADVLARVRDGNGRIAADDWIRLVSR